MVEHGEQPTAWETYEQVAGYLLDTLAGKFGLERVEGRQKLLGKSGMNWTIDAKGVRVGGGGIVVIECRRYTTSRIKAEDMGALAYRIGDVGASGGIVVTPIGVQEGGQLIAEREGIKTVHLDADSTTTDYVLRFLDSVFIGTADEVGITDTFTAETLRPDEPAL